jgi:tRNA U34 5-carboxymethylaminomethyl modifying GTPase MnmE/TrmE
VVASTVAVSDAASSAGVAGGPEGWLICNKIDLIDQTVNKNESKNQFNKPLKNIDNNKLTHKSEYGLQTNKSLPNVVSKYLSYSSDLEFISISRYFDISATLGEGFDALLAELASHAESHLAGGEQALVTRARHRQALEETVIALDRTLASDLAGQEDLLAEELRGAAAALGRLTGRVDVEDVLDVIFRDFCIGK